MPRPNDPEEQMDAVELCEAAMCDVLKALALLDDLRRLRCGDPIPRQEPVNVVLLAARRRQRRKTQRPRKPGA